MIDSWAGVHARSGDGSVSIRAEPGSEADADWDITTGDGSVTLEVPDGFGAELDASAADEAAGNLVDFDPVLAHLGPTP